MNDLDDPRSPAGLDEATPDELARIRARTTPFDAARFLATPSQMAAYLSAALSENDSGAVAEALGTIARARGMSAVAEAAGLNRVSLYRGLSRTGAPELATVLKVADALGLQLAASPKPATA